MKLEEFEKMIKNLNDNSNIKELYESTKKSFNDSFNSSDRERIEYLNAQVSKLEEIEKENKRNKDRLDIFANNIIKKYCDKSIEIDKSKLDYSSLENFDKSIVKQLEDKDISVKINKDNNNNNNKEEEKKLYV